MSLPNITGSTGAVILALAVVGCATAAVITGHITGNDYLAVLAGIGFGGSVVTTAHIVGNQVSNAATSSTTASTPPPTP